MQNTYGVVYSWDESNNLTRCLYLFCHTYLAQMRIWKFLERAPEHLLCEKIVQRRVELI